MKNLSTKDLRNDKQLKSLTLLLKCLKIMENATFLSKDNQVQLHLFLFFTKKFVTILFFFLEIDMTFSYECIFIFPSLGGFKHYLS